MTVGLIIVFSIGLVGTIETIRRLAQAAEASNMSNSDDTRLIELPYRSQMEINLVTICANLPAFASLWNYIRRRRNESKITTTPVGRDRISPTYFGESLEKSDGTVTSTTVVGESMDVEKLSMDGEQFSIKHGSIVRTTRLQVDIAG